MKTLINISFALAACGMIISGCSKSGTQQQNSAGNQPPSKQETQEPAQHGAAVTPLDYHKLQSYLPDIAGYKKGVPEGSALQMDNLTYTEAGATYTNGNATIKVTIFDYAGMPDMLNPYKSKFSFENDEGYTKSAEWNGFGGWETWEKSSGSASAIATVGNRIAVMVEGEQQLDASLVHSAMNAIDLKGIAALCGTHNY